MIDLLSPSAHLEIEKDSLYRVVCFDWEAGSCRSIDKSPKSEWILENKTLNNCDRLSMIRLQLGTEAIMKYLRNRLTVDDGTQGNDQKNFDIPRPVETEEERRRRLYTEHHVVRSTGTFDFRYVKTIGICWETMDVFALFFSHKNASQLSDESIELISREKPNHINLSKNKFDDLPKAWVEKESSIDIERILDSSSDNFRLTMKTVRISDGDGLERKNEKLTNKTFSYWNWTFCFSFQKIDASLGIFVAFRFLFERLTSIESFGGKIKRITILRFKVRWNNSIFSWRNFLFSTNRLTDLPMELSQLEHLQIINLSMNK